MQIKRITVADKIEQVMPLLREHWDEIARNKQVMVLKPMTERYAELERAGMLIGLGAYDGDELIGYAVTIVCPGHLHYADLCYAANDVLFVRKDHRRGTLGIRLITETERIAKLHGARFVTWHAKQNTTLCTLMERMGYGVQDINYSKEL